MIYITSCFMVALCFLADNQVYVGEVCLLYLDILILKRVRPCRRSRSLHQSLGMTQSSDTGSYKWGRKKSLHLHYEMNNQHFGKHRKVWILKVVSLGNELRTKTRELLSLESHGEWEACRFGRKVPQFSCSMLAHGFEGIKTRFCASKERTVL